jgi:hypothetical protein
MKREINLFIEINTANASQENTSTFHTRQIHLAG